jgi:hypothetical protein
LHGKDPDPFAVRYAGEAVRDANPNSLLAANKRPDAGCRGSFDQGVGRVAAQKFDSLTLEYLANRIHDFH